METTELVTFLSMACPFDASEKQALLEAQDTEARMHVLLSVLEMSGVVDDGGAGTRH
jgi:Lon protease-like protein